MIPLREEFAVLARGDELERWPTLKAAVKVPGPWPGIGQEGAGKGPEVLHGETTLPEITTETPQRISPKPPFGERGLPEVLLEEGSADRAANSITRAPAGSLHVLGGSRGRELAARNRIDDPDLPDCENDSIDPGPSRCVDDYLDLGSCLLGVGRGGGSEPGDDDDGFDMENPGLMPWDVICDPER